MELTETWFLLLSAALFSIGLAGILIRKNPLIMFMCAELMLNAVNIAFIAFSERLQDIAGQSAILFILVVAAAEVVIGLSLVVLLQRRNRDLVVDDLSELRG